jgi:mono/diheme cytochrome c family protein
MRTIIASIIIAGLIVVLGGFTVIYTGVYNVAATEPHWRVTRWILETARVRSIKAHAADVQIPPGLDDPAKIPMGVEHFAAHCAICHGAPGVPRGDIADRLYPQPPDLTLTAQAYTDGELFWILKHGIKLTGMPAWADHTDKELWATVAFLRKLPGMTPEDYAKLVMQSIQAAGPHHDSDHGQAPPAHTSSPGPHPR